MEMSQGPFCVEIYRKNAGPLFPARHFARACAVETHMDISQVPFFALIYRKECRTLHSPPAFDPSHKNPLSVAILFGDK